MGVNIHIHKTHRQYTDGLDIVETDGNTIGDCLKKLVEKYPDLENEIFEKKETLHNYVEIYLNLESAYPDELKRPVVNGDSIYLTIMLAGG